MEIDRGVGPKRKRIYHINLLSPWKSRDTVEHFATLGLSSSELSFEEVYPFCTKVETWEDVIISQDLNTCQVGKIRRLLEEYSDIFSSIRGRTDITKHTINTVQAAPICSAEYRVPQKLEEQVKLELGKMISTGIVQPSKSPLDFTCDHCATEKCRWEYSILCGLSKVE